MIRYLTPWLGGHREFPPPPRNVREFYERFPTEDSCRDYLFAQRYPEGFSCRKCSSTSFRWLDSKHLLCARPLCRTRASLTANTILHGTRKPLRDWFRAAFEFVQRGACARELQRRVNLTYKIAWLWAHKLRRVMASKTTLDEPFPPFSGPPSRSAESRHFSNNGGFRWRFARSDGLGACCQRLTKPDWDYPDHDAQPERNRLARSGYRTWLAYEALFRETSGSVSDKHLRSYFDAAEFRINRARVPGHEAALELISRFAETPPSPYRKVTGPPLERSPLLVWNRGAPHRPRPGDPAFEVQAWLWPES